MAKGIGPLLLLGGAAAIYFLGKKKGVSAKCPAEIQLAELTESAAKNAWETAGGDPIQAANILFSELVPEGCTKQDYKTIATNKWLKDFRPYEWNLSMVYAAIVAFVLDANVDWQDEDTVAQGRVKMQQIATWYSQLTGEPLPDID